MGSFTEKVRNFIDRHQLITNQSKLLVGVSGGPDSLALLHFFMSLREEMDLHLSVAHVDHMFRGDQSFSELKYVERLCSEWDIPFYGKRINVPEEIAKRSGNPQSVSRRLRYAFYEEVMRERNIPLLALAHHADDQMETILMRLTRGASVGASAGMRVKRSFGTGWIIRPFLCITRSDIEEYIEENQLKPVYDPSNKKDIYTRNRYRKHVLPFLKEENPKAHRHFQQFSEDMFEDDDYLASLAAEAYEEIVERERDGLLFNIQKFLQLPPPLQRRFLFLTVTDINKGAYVQDLSASHIRTAIDMLKEKGPSSHIDLPGNIRLTRSYDYGFVTANRGTKGFHFPLDKGDSVTLPTGERFYVKEGAVRGEEERIFRLHPNTKFPLHIRTRREGDRIRLKGNGGTKKLKSLFIDGKIPSFMRDEWPIVTDANGEILWVPLVKKSAFEATIDETVRTLHFDTLTSGRNKNMKQDIEKILLSEEEIQEKIKELGKTLTEEYEGRNPLAIGVLKGAMPFMADLVKRIDTYLEMDFMDVSSYGGKTVSSGEVKILKDLDTSIEGRDVLIIEDIIDSGLTLHYLVELFRYRKAKSIKIVTLLDKPEGRKVDIQADYVGFSIPNEFVVGYGLDYEEKYRNLPYVGVLKPEVYASK